MVLLQAAFLFTKMKNWSFRIANHVALLYSVRKLVNISVDSLWPNRRFIA